MSQEHESQLWFSTNVSNLSILGLQVEREQVLCAIIIILVNYIVMARSSLRDK